MMTSIALLCGAALAGSADGIDNELSIELGSMAATDPTVNVLTGADALSSGGVRVGYGISPNLAVIASWHRSRHDAGAHTHLGAPAGPRDAPARPGDGARLGG